MFGNILGFVVSIYTVTLRRLHRIFCGLFNDWLHFHNGGNDPAIHLGTQETILDGTLPKEWAEEMKLSLRRRANYREVRQAAAFLMRIRNSYSSSGRSFACQPFNIRSLFDMIWEMSFRLANVIIEQQSFEVLIPHYDRVDSFFYAHAYCFPDNAYASVQITEVQYAIDRNLIQRRLCQMCLDSINSLWFTTKSLAEYAIISFEDRTIQPLLNAYPRFSAGNFGVDCEFKDGGDIDLLIHYCSNRYE